MFLLSFVLDLVLGLAFLAWFTIAFFRKIEHVKTTTANDWKSVKVKGANLK
jgi:tellurite resistance protein TehA-like permease